MQQEQIGAQAQPVAINWMRLGLLLLLTLVAPVGFALLFDVLLGTSPTLVMVVGLLAIPVATLVVIRTALIEFDRVIAAVAPPEQTTDDDEHEHLIVDGAGEWDANT